MPWRMLLIFLQIQPILTTGKKICELFVWCLKAFFLGPYFAPLVRQAGSCEGTTFGHEAALVEQVGSKHAHGCVGQQVTF